MAFWLFDDHYMPGGRMQPGDNQREHLRHADADILEIYALTLTLDNHLVARGSTQGLYVEAFRQVHRTQPLGSRCDQCCFRWHWLSSSPRSPARNATGNQRIDSLPTIVADSRRH